MASSVEGQKGLVPIVGGNYIFIQKKKKKKFEQKVPTSQMTCVPSWGGGGLLMAQVPSTVMF